MLGVVWIWCVGLVVDWIVGVVVVGMRNWWVGEVRERGFIGGGGGERVGIPERDSII